MDEKSVPIFNGDLSMRSSTLIPLSSAGDGYPLVVFTMMLAVTLLAPSLDAEKPHTLVTELSMLEVLYDHVEDRLSIQARHVVV
jgi:hypothetical protein